MSIIIQIGTTHVKCQPFNGFHIMKTMIFNKKFNRTFGENCKSTKFVYTFGFS